MPLLWTADRGAVLMVFQVAGPFGKLWHPVFMGHVVGLPFDMWVDCTGATLDFSSFGPFGWYVIVRPD